MTNYEAKFNGVSYIAREDNPRLVHDNLCGKIPELKAARNYRYNVYAVAHVPTKSVRFAVNMILREEQPLMLLYERMRSNSPAQGYIQVSPYFDDLADALEVFEEICETWTKVTGLTLDGKIAPTKKGNYRKRGTDARITGERGLIES